MTDPILSNIMEPTPGMVILDMNEDKEFARLDILIKRKDASVLKKVLCRLISEEKSGISYKNVWIGVCIHLALILLWWGLVLFIVVIQCMFALLNLKS